MLSLPDFREKQIVFIQSFDNKNFKFSNSNFVLCDKDGKVEYKISCFRIFAIFIQGDFTITSALIRKAQSYGISIFLLNRNLSLYSKIMAETEGNYVLREKQYTDVTTLEKSKKIIKNKISNQLSLIKAKRKKIDLEKRVIKKLTEILDKVDLVDSYESLLGLEGNASKYFFQCYFKNIGWQKRLPRTKYDIPNLLLDIGYTYLFNFIDANLCLYGFDNYKGIYHQPFYQRKSLTCDLVEPFRCIVDKTLVKAYNLNRIDEKDFSKYKGNYRLDWKNSKKYTQIFLEAVMEHKEDIFKYIQDYYRNFMKDSTEIPEFNI